jgi:aspartate aminotransferase
MRDIILAGRMDAMNESATLALNARAKQLASEGKTIYNLTAGELSTDTPDYIQKAVAPTLKLNKYTAVAGMPKLRQIIAEESRAFYGLDWIQPKNIVVTAGAKPALYASLLALINPGDEVIVPVPAWVSYLHLIELVGGVVVQVPLTDSFDIDPAAVKSKLSPRTKAILVNSPHNPTGAIFSESALEGLAAVLRGSSVTVIADDIYSKLVYDDNFTLVPTIGFEQLIIVNGFSKSQALTGWRIGYVIASEPVAQAIMSLLSHITGNAAVPSQEAALAAMAEHDQPPTETLSMLKGQRQQVDTALKNVAGITYHLPGGAFYFFLDLRAITDNSAEWCERLLMDAGVALVPGEAFLAPGFARLTFSAEGSTLSKALTKISDFIEVAK